MTPPEAAALLKQMQALGLAPRIASKEDFEIAAQQWAKAMPFFRLEECEAAVLELSKETQQGILTMPRPGIVEAAVYKLRTRHREEAEASRPPEEKPQAERVDDFGTRGRPLWDYPRQASEVAAACREFMRKHPCGQRDDSDLLAYIHAMAAHCGLLKPGARAIEREPGMEG